jgi:hypothetical protein
MKRAYDGRGHHHQRGSGRGFRGSGWGGGPRGGPPWNPWHALEAQLGLPPAVLERRLVGAWGAGGASPPAGAQGAGGAAPPPSAEVAPGADGEGGGAAPP